MAKEIVVRDLVKGYPPPPVYTVKAEIKAADSIKGYGVISIECILHGGGASSPQRLIMHGLVLAKIQCK